VQLRFHVGGGAAGERGCDVSDVVVEIKVIDEPGKPLLEVFLAGEDMFAVFVEQIVLEFTVDFGAEVAGIKVFVDVNASPVRNFDVARCASETHLSLRRVKEKFNQLKTVWLHLSEWAVCKFAFGISIRAFTKICESRPRDFFS
jgi:hypothetical protein